MVSSKGQIRPFLEEIHNAAQHILLHAKKENIILVISHMDADGISGAGIIGVALSRLQIPFRIRVERWFDTKVVESIAVERKALTVLTDMGSGYLDIINEKVKGKPLIILDHHQPIGESEDNFIHVNPHVFGFDGARDISGAGIAYLIAKAISEENRDLAFLGVVGALGDMQDKNKERSLGGINQLIVEDAINSGKLETMTDLIFFWSRNTSNSQSFGVYNQSCYSRYKWRRR